MWGRSDRKKKDDKKQSVPPQTVTAYASPAPRSDYRAIEESPSPSSSPSRMGGTARSTDASSESVGGPVRVAWRESALTRKLEIESLADWAQHCQPPGSCAILPAAVHIHLAAVKEAAERARPKPHRFFNLFRNGALKERAMSNLDAAEAQLLNFAPPEYVLGQFPSLLCHVRRHLLPTDPRRVELERIAQKLGVKDADHPLLIKSEPSFRARKAIVVQERGQIVTATRAASSFLSSVMPSP